MLTSSPIRRQRVQDAVLARLLALTQRKANVESQIIKHIQELGEAYEVVRGDFEAVLKGRSEDVREAIDGLRELEDKGCDSPHGHQ